MPRRSHATHIILLVCISAIGVAGILFYYYNPLQMSSSSMRDIYPPNASPIDINNPGDIVSYGLPGLGTVDDPYRIENKIIDANGNVGIRLFYPAVYLVQDCIVYNAMIGIECGNSVNNSIIRGCRISETWLNVNRLTYGIKADATTSNITINDCSISQLNNTASGEYGIYLWGTSHTVINCIFTTLIQPVVFDGSWGVVTNCTFSNIMSCGIFARGQYHAFYNNTFTDIGIEPYYGSAGIECDDAMHCSIINNTLTRGFSNAFSLWSGCTNITIQYNTAIDVRYCGILLRYSHDCTVTDNYINNTQYGFVILFNTVNLNCSFNLIENILYSGFNMKGITASNFTFNIIYNASTGFFAETSDSDPTVGNTFADNHITVQPYGNCFSQGTWISQNTFTNNTCIVLPNPYVPPNEDPDDQNLTWVWILSGSLATIGVIVGIARWTSVGRKRVWCKIFPNTKVCKM